MLETNRFAHYAIALAILYPTFAIAQTAESPAVPKDNTELNHSPARTADVIHPIENNRAYRNRKNDSLLEHERFDTTNIPPGYTPHTWRQEQAATDAYDRGYESGFEEGFRAAQQILSESNLRSVFDEAMSRGDAQFKKGRYGIALRHFILAAEKDQGDAVSRLKAAHAMAALGHYENAYRLIRRGLQLHPDLMMLEIDIRSYFPSPQSFKTILDKASAEARKQDRATHWAVVGYLHFFSGGSGAAHEALKMATQHDPRDGFLRKFSKVAKLSVPADTEHAAVPIGSQRG